MQRQSAQHMLPIVGDLCATLYANKRDSVLYIPMHEALCAKCASLQHRALHLEHA